MIELVIKKKRHRIFNISARILAEMCGSQRNFRVQLTSQLCRILPSLRNGTKAPGEKDPGRAGISGRGSSEMV